MSVQIQLRRDTAFNWASVNPILAQGEIGLEYDTSQIKIGDGLTPWNTLIYFTGSDLSSQILLKFNNLSDLDSIPDARNNLGLGTAALEDVGYFEVAGAADVVQDNLDFHTAQINNPHQVTKSQVGLSNVPNVNATNPVNIVETENYRFVTDTEKSTWNNKQDALGFTPVPDTRTVAGQSLDNDIVLSKGDVGLSNVDNTSDLDKPVSTAVTTELDLIKNRVTNAITTMILSGCQIIWVEGGTTVDITPGKVLFSTNYPNKLNPTYSIVDYPGVTGLEPDYLTTDVGSFFYINPLGVLEQYPSAIPIKDMADLCALGWIAHYNYTSISYGLLETYPMENSEGNEFFPNADLTINRTAGEIFDGGVGVEADPKTPNEYYSNAIPVVTLSYTYQDSLLEWQYPDGVTEVDPNNYNELGVGLSPVPTGKWTIQKLFMYLDLSHDVEYGQVVYDTKEEAIAALGVETIDNPDVSFNIYRCAIVVKQGATDLSDPSQAVLKKIDRFSTVASSSGAGTGEVNTASNIGTEGIGFYSQKIGVDLQFKNLVSKTSDIILTNNSTNKTVELTTLNTFEKINKNLKTYPYSLNYTLNKLTSIIYIVGSQSITKTLNYTGDNVTSIVLSGDGLPSGTQTTKTFTYTGSNLTSVSYS
jgi:hypothetical protein